MQRSTKKSSLIEVSSSVRATVAQLLIACLLLQSLTPQENWNVVLTPLGAEFHDHTGLDYHQRSKKLILSANSPSGAPHGFELLGADAAHSAFSNVAGFGGDVIVAAARD